MEPPAAADHSGVFKPTRWSLVLRASNRRDPAAAAALDELCGAYWYPLYCFARRRGLLPPDAEDATQGFFARILEKETLAGADPERGRLRTFLLTAFQRHLVNFDAHRFAEKRGGRAATLSFDDAEHRYGAEPADANSPEKIFERPRLSICARLSSEGHIVTAVVRSEDVPAIAAASRTIVVDLAVAARTQDWQPHLTGIDAVVNCAGVLQDSPRESTKGVHVEGVSALFAACEAEGVRRVIHFSCHSFNQCRKHASSVFVRSSINAFNSFPASSFGFLVMYRRTICT